MIERQKAVVVRDPFHNGASDPVTGVSCDGLRQPWGWASYIRADVDESIGAWHGLIRAINERLPQPHPEPLSDPPGLFDVSDLVAAGIAEDSFAWQFYRKARRPHFQFLDPDLQVPSPQQLTENLALFETAWVNCAASYPSSRRPYKPGHPLPIILGQSHTKFWSDAHRADKYRSEIKSLPWGLYLNVQHNPRVPCPYEDGSRLVLPALREDVTASSLWPSCTSSKSNLVSDNGIDEDLLTILGDAIPRFVGGSYVDAALSCSAGLTGLLLDASTTSSFVGKTDAFRGALSPSV
jgi:hypothetical protein